ncbi:MAG: response regulator [Desulfobacterales bacterium]|nr:response regulator [Desulfobacterales bacterium]
MKILLIEDKGQVRRLLKKWLEELDCEVIEASNGNEGLDLYYDHRPDLVITDIVMPEKDGIQVMIELRRDFPDVKIFTMSGAGAEAPGEYLTLAKDVRALRTFVKPIDKGVLLAAVAEYLPETNLN